MIFYAEILTTDRENDKQYDAMYLCADSYSHAAGIIEEYYGATLEIINDLIAVAPDNYFACTVDKTKRAAKDLRQEVIKEEIW